MTQYAILLPGNEAAWQEATEEQRAQMYDRHRRFMDLLAERGHVITGGAELTPSHEARVVRGDLDAVTVSEGPYAETVEQLTGFYTVESSDLDDLLKVCGLLAGSGAVEVRAAVVQPADPEQAERTEAAVRA
ncbi:MAG: hypothetical protein QOF53_2430 [Nocardioidaceae bacterium]|jgi:hypothetical protein|nr:hypothetical protein [Nocardioidaceae bacterium]